MRKVATESGTCRSGRLNALLDRVAVRELDMVIIEDTDRMARDLADLAWTFK